MLFQPLSYFCKAVIDNIKSNTVITITTNCCYYERKLYIYIVYIYIVCKSEVHKVRPYVFLLNCGCIHCTVLKHTCGRFELIMLI